MRGLKVFGEGWRRQGSGVGGLETPVTGGEICYEAADGSGRVWQLGGPSSTERSHIEPRVEFAKRLLPSITR